MPVMSGTLAIRSLRRKNPKLRFIAMSGLVQSDKLVDQLGTKDIPFLAKPFAIEKLLRTVHQVVTPRRPDAETPSTAQAA